MYAREHVKDIRLREAILHTTPSNTGAWSAALTTLGDRDDLQSIADDSTHLILLDKESIMSVRRAHHVEWPSRRRRRDERLLQPDWEQPIGVDSHDREGTLNRREGFSHPTPTLPNVK